MTDESLASECRTLLRDRAERRRSPEGSAPHALAVAAERISADRVRRELAARAHKVFMLDGLASFSLDAAGELVVVTPQGAST